jgi:hypothetical protein
MVNIRNSSFVMYFVLHLVTINKLSLTLYTGLRHVNCETVSILYLVQRIKRFYLLRKLSSTRISDCIGLLKISSVLFVPSSFSIRYLLMHIDFMYMNCSLHTRIYFF